MANAKHDQNAVATLIGVSSLDLVTPTLVAVDPVTGRVLVDSGSTTNTFVYNEIVSGSGTTFTLANTPVSGLYAIYGRGQRLTPGGGNDFTLSGATITTTNTWAAGDILADYQH